MSAQRLGVRLVVVVVVVVVVSMAHDVVWRWFARRSCATKRAASKQKIY